MLTDKGRAMHTTSTELVWGKTRTTTPFLMSCSGHKLLRREWGLMDQLERIKKSAVIKRSILIIGLAGCICVRLGVMP